MPITAIQPRRLYQQIADQLRDLIEGGEFRPGDRLPAERDLAEQFGISRPTVREALIALEVEGRIRIRVGAGIFVTERAPTPSPKNAAIEGPFELLRARELVEGAVAAQAALQVTPAHVAALDQLIDAMQAATHPSCDTLALDRDFHTAIADILGNAVIVRFVGELFDERINPYFERLSGYFENAETWQTALQEHRVIRDAIAAGDPEAATRAMRHHLQQSQQRFSPTFGEEADPGGETGAA